MMKRNFLCALVSLLLSAVLAQRQQLTIQTENGKQAVLARGDIVSLPHTKVVTHGSDTPATAKRVA
ncbi:MAG TPA: hypothetical protein VEI49_08965 [Terriglobales bacterium]|nr:hypothetical protein [Terriglobales bacterium]